MSHIWQKKQNTQQHGVVWTTDNYLSIVSTVIESLESINNDWEQVVVVVCHIQVHLSGNNVPTVKPPLNHTSLPSTAATFLATHLMVVLQSSGYSVFHGGDTPIQLLWRSYSCQCLNTETSTQGNRGFTTETPNISYNISLYIRLVVTL